jgi:predicted nuclease of predicted toxin-antitoxin system
VEEALPARLLIDQNLHAGLARHLADLFPASRHVRDFGLRQGNDRAIWDTARREGMIIVTRDSDFRVRSLAAGHPPKVIWLNVGNCSKSAVEVILRDGVERIHTFAADPAAALLVLP